MFWWYFFIRFVTSSHKYHIRHTHSHPIIPLINNQLNWYIFILWRSDEIFIPSRPRASDTTPIIYTYESPVSCAYSSLLSWPTMIANTSGHKCQHDRPCRPFDSCQTIYMLGRLCQACRFTLTSFSSLIFANWVHFNKKNDAKPWISSPVGQCALVLPSDSVLNLSSSSPQEAAKE